MPIRIRLLYVAVISLSVAACSLDEAKQHQATTPSPHATDIAKQGTATFDSTGKTRSADALTRSGFAGFGRVGRTHFADADYRARWAIIVGVNQFKHMNDLDNAVNDARAIRDTLRDEFGYDEERIIFLADQNTGKRPAAGASATIAKGDVLKAFADLASRDIRANDSVFFFFAGHGKSDAKSAYLAGFDSQPDDLDTWVNIATIKQLLAQIPARHKLIILDSCYAGSILQVDLSKEPNTNANINPPAPQVLSPNHATTRSDGGDEAMELRDNLSYYLQEPAFLAITSGRDQPVGDASKARPDHSPFTTSLLTVLNERANSVRPGDVFTARELAVRVESLVRKGQTPDWGRLSGGRGDFIFKPTRDRLTPRERAVRDDYGLKIAFADMLIDRNNRDLDDRTSRDDIRKILDSCSPELRGCEWYRLQQRLDTSLHTMGKREHVVGSFSSGAAVTCVAISPDGNLIASGEVDQKGLTGDFFGKIKVWDANGGREQPLLTLSGHDDGVSSIAFSHDGQRIISGGGDDIIKIWDAKNGGDPLMELTTDEDAVATLALSNDGNRIASGTMDGHVIIWDAKKNARPLHILLGHSKRVMDVTFSSDDKQIISASEDKSIKVWNAERGGAAEMTLISPTQIPTCIAISHDGTRIMSGTWDGTINIWDTKTGKPITGLKSHTGAVTSLVFDGPTKKLFSSSVDKTIKVWGGKSTPYATLRGHGDAIMEVAINRRTNRIVSASRDSTVKSWAFYTLDDNVQFLPPMTDDDNDRVVVFSPDGKFMATGGDRDLPDNKTTGTLRLWQVEGQPRLLLDLVGHTAAVRGVAFTKDGKRLASAGGDNTVKIWDAHRGGDAMMTLTGHDKIVFSVAFSPDGKRLVSGSWDNTVKVWDLERGVESVVLTGIGDTARSVSFSPDGLRIVSGGARISDGRVRGTVLVWDAQRGGKPLMTLPCDDEDVMSVSYSPDGKRIVSGGVRLVSGREEGVIRVWDAERGGAPMAIMRGHSTSVSSAVFTANGKRIISAGTDGTIKVWDAERYGDAMINLLDNRKYDFTSVAIHANGLRVAATNKSSIRGILMWDDRR